MFKYLLYSTSLKLLDKNVQNCKLQLTILYALQKWILKKGQNLEIYLLGRTWPNFT